LPGSSKTTASREFHKAGRRCAVAIYLSRTFGVRADVRASAIQIEDLDSGERFYIKPPRPVRSFIIRFDNGRFPKLVRSGVVDEPKAPCPDDSFMGDTEQGELLDPAVTEVA
jgi:hypothetical protein